MTQKFVKHALFGLVAPALMLGGVQSALAQSYPERPIEVIMTFGPGGGADSMGRQMGRLLEQRLNVAFPVVNVAGASGNAGLTQLLGNEADGYSIATMIALTVSSWAAGLGSSTVDDFEVVAVTQDSPSMLFVPRNSPFKTFKDFLDHAKANPGQLKVATSGYGTQDDITLKYLGSLGFETTNVPFSRPAERYSAPLGGHTDMIYEEPGDVAQLLQAGQLRPLVVFDDKRHASFPDVETSREHDMDISDLPNFRTIVVKKGTPADRIETLRTAINDALESDEWKAFCAQTYTCTRIYSPEEARSHVSNFYETVKARLAATN